jgi:hypothetical protein
MKGPELQDIAPWLKPGNPLAKMAVDSVIGPSNGEEREDALSKPSHSCPSYQVHGNELQGS